MRVKVKGHRVLVRQENIHEHDEVYKRAKQAGLEISFDSDVRYQASVDQGTVVDVGDTAWKDFGVFPWAQIGDTVIFVKHAGKSVTDPDEKDVKSTDKTPYVILNDEDILAVITPKE